MDYARQQRDPARHMLGIGVVILVHALVIWALLSGLGNSVIQIIKKPLNATIIEEVKLPPPPPPPPPPKKVVEMPKTPPPPIDTYVPPPDNPMPTQNTAPVISATTQTAPTEAHVIQAPPVAAPPAPPKPAVRRGIARVAGDDPTYPKEAIRAGVSKGRVVARLNIDEKGNVTEVNITVSEPPRVFDKVVRAALENWKFRAEGEKYVGEVEINFSLKDE
jgi:periplasmic protein TonB